MPQRIKSSIPARAQSREALAIGAVITAIVLTSPVYAHDGTGLAGGFTSGFLHPVSGFDHALAMVAVGLWGAILGRPLLIALPTIFPIMMAIGGALGMAGVTVPPVEIGIAISVVTLGLMVLFSIRAPVLLACAIVAVFALFHGYAHGQELPFAANPVEYSVGFVLCTGLLHGLGIAIGALRALPVGTAAVRTAGGAIALSGLWFLNGALFA